MTDLKTYFLDNARLSRRAFADFLRVDRADVDDLAEDLDLGDRLTLDEAQELMLALDEADDDEADDDEADDDEADDDEADDDDDEIEGNSSQEESSE